MLPSGRVPLMSVAIQSLALGVLGEGYGSVSDAYGEMLARFDHKIINDNGTVLRLGTILLLKEVNLILVFF